MAKDVVGLLLAAGASSRLGEPKQLLADADGVPMVVRMARALRDAGCAPVLVVVGANEVPVRVALAREAVTIVPNDGWAQGMGRSIAVGVSAAQTIAPTAIGVMIAACDMPSVSASHLTALLASFSANTRVASQYIRDDGAEVRGIPALLPRRDWEWLGLLSGDQGARPLFQAEQTLTVFLPHGTLDLDTPADVVAWRASGTPNQDRSP